MTKSVIIYTDGACSGNPGPGGWAAHIIDNGEERSLCDHEPDTTNNRMELMAAIRGLEALEKPRDVTLYTDSKYLLNGMETWTVNWQRNHWRTAAGKPVKNKDLWLILLELQKKHRIRFVWVKGHNNDHYNELVDGLAQRESLR